MAIPTALIDMLEETWTSISALCADFSEADWKTPTQLPGWSVQDNISHLVAFENELEGIANPVHVAADVSHTRNALGEQNEHQVDAYRHLPGTDILAMWTEISARRLRTLRTADESHFAREVAMPTGPGTVADFLQLRVLDAWTHEQDIRRALGRPGHQGGPSAEHTIDRLIRTVPMVVVKRAGLPAGSGVVITVTGAVSRTIVVTNADGKGALGGNGDDAVCTITMDSDIFLQLGMGRGEPGLLARQCDVSGDIDIASRILSNFTMMI